MATVPSQVEELERRALELQPDIEHTMRQAQEITRLRRANMGLAARADLSRSRNLGDVISGLESDLQNLRLDLAAAQRLPVMEPSLIDARWTTPRAPGQEFGKRSLNTIKTIVVEHTATLADIAPDSLAAMHVGQGKPAIACHFLVGYDGTTYWTQPFEIAVTHTLDSEVNRDSIAVSLAGNFNGEAPGEAQLEAAAELLAWLVGLFGLDLTAIRGRREIEDVSSPGAQWMQGAHYKGTLLALVYELLGGDPGRAAPEGRGWGPLASQPAPRVSKPQVVDLVNSLPKHPTLAPYPKRSVPISALAIHHTDTQKGMTVQQLAQYHVYGVRKDTRGNLIKAQWPGIGYHFVIASDGTINQTQREQTRSYHVGSKGNETCLGISFVGRFMRYGYDGKLQRAEDQIPTPAQLRSGGQLVAWLMQEFNVASEKVMGHKDVVGGGTACPGEHWEGGLKWRNLLWQEIQKALDATQECDADHPIEHYLLFWDHGTSWAANDWQGAQNYIAHFRPTAGFSVQDALQARHVTIVGSTAGVSATDEARLRAACVQVHRLGGATEKATKAMLDALVAKNTPWPGALPGLVRATQEADSRHLEASCGGESHPVEPDEWTVPDDWEQLLARLTRVGEPESDGD
jgi:N-acetyl-anhydromuramyl-L-alanine amidase AmpD